MKSPFATQLIQGPPEQKGTLGLVPIHFSTESNPIPILGVGGRGRGNLSLNPFSTGGGGHIMPTAVLLAPHDFQAFRWPRKVMFTTRLVCRNVQKHGLRTSNEGINQGYLKNWANVADKYALAVPKIWEWE